MGDRMERQEKWALVTGGGKRIGRAIALSLAEGGADIVLHVHTSSGTDVAQAIESLGRRVVVLHADLSTAEGARQLGQAAWAVTGHIDILVNNAAVFSPMPLPTLTTTSWRATLQTNLTSPFVLSLLLGRAMRARGRGKIVQLGDWSGIRPAPHYLTYCVAKSGIFALTQAFAKAFAPYVQVNAVAPGPVLPPASYTKEKLRTLITQTPLRRGGHEHDIARTVRFFAEAADFVTGATYTVDGGWLAKVGDGSATSL